MPVVENAKREVRSSVKAELRAVRASEPGKLTLVGYAAVYDQKSEPIGGQFYEVVKRGAFRTALEGKDDVRALFDHQSSMVLGRAASKTLRLADDAHGLRVEIDLPDTQLARDLAVSVERGDINQMSFGFFTRDDKWVKEKTEDGIQYWLRQLIDVELFDVSVVTYPAYPQTEIAKRSLERAKAMDQARLRAAELRYYEATA
jgi:HK97 family phage prohead protease